MKTADRAKFKRIGAKGDAHLLKSTISIAGLGGVGATVAAVLAREHITLRLIDSGRVEERDMHRLALFYDDDITKFKVKQAKVRLAGINPSLVVKSFHEEISPDSLFLLQGDCIVDATNNPEINELTIPFAAKKKLPLVLVRYSGSKANILVLQKSPPAKILEKISLPLIEKDGIFGPVTTMAGSAAAGQVLRVLLGEKGSYLLQLDAWDLTLKTTKL